MSELPTTLAENVKKLAVEYIGNQVKQISEGMGGRASDAQKLSEAEELEAWMRATATPEEIASLIEQGATDEELHQAARKYRYALGKAAGRNDPRRETDYHDKMAQKAQAKLMELAGMGAGEV